MRHARRRSRRAGCGKWSERDRPGRASFAPGGAPMTDTLKKIRKDFNAALAMDPAATSRLEVALTYAGFHALLFHRMAHWMLKHRVPFLPRAVSQFARFLTGIE